MTEPKIDNAPFVPRTDEEVLAQINAESEKDFFGFYTNDLIETLSFEHAKPFLKDNVTSDDWKPEGRSYEAVVARIRDYLPFAWEKASDCRGLSAGRSIMHMQAWLWLIREEKAAAQIENYQHYGKPQLRAISEWAGFDWEGHDLGGWRNSEDGPGCAPYKVELAFTRPAAALPPAAE